MSSGFWVWNCKDVNLSASKESTEENKKLYPIVNLLRLICLDSVDWLDQSGGNAVCAKIKKSKSLDNVIFKKIFIKKNGWHRIIKLKFSFKEHFSKFTPKGSIETKMDQMCLFCATVLHDKQLYGNILRLTDIVSCGSHIL